MKWLFGIVLLLSLVKLSYQCGVTTHNVIANRALHWYMSDHSPTTKVYKKIIEDNLESFQAGAAFPDWGYHCIMSKYVPNLREGSDLAHWLPFQKATIGYIRHTYGQNPYKNKKAHELLAFLFGVIAHSIADDIWHDLDYVYPSRQGFIPALGNSNCLYDKHSHSCDPHTISDVGGEFVAAFQVDMNFLKNEWAPPTKDIINIYKQMNYTFEYSEVTLDVCIAELYTEVEAISKLPSETLLAYYDKIAPFLFEEYQDWWLGGVNSNALWVSYCWNQTINWLNNGVPKDPNAKYCFPLTGKEVINSKQVSYADRRIKSRKIIKSIIEDFQQNPKTYKLKSIQSPKHICKKSDELYKFQPNNLERNSLFGSSITSCDLTGNGYNDIIIGAPGYDRQRGSIYIYYNNNGTFKETQIKYEQEYGSQFGYSLECIDLNRDGHNNLIIGIPGHKMWPNMEYTGKIRVYSKGTNNYVDYEGKYNYYNLGNILQKGDVNGDGYDDLLIGIPYSYNISLTDPLYYHHDINTNFESGQVSYILSAKTPLEPKVLLSSTNNDFWNWLGYTSKIIKYNSSNYLLTSMPNYNNGTNSIGALTCYNMSNHKELAWQIVGNFTNGKLGFSFDTLEDTLVLAVPTDTVDWLSQGKVYVLSMEQLFKRKDSFLINDLYIDNTFIGNNFYSRLGWTTKFVEDKLIISEPYYMTHGAVHIISKNRKHQCLTNDVAHSQYGLIVEGFNNYLLVGSPRDSTVIENGGSVSLINIS
jgi:hypothetical protein